MEAQTHEETRLGVAFLVAIVGMVVPAAVVSFLVLRANWTANDVTSLAGLFTGMTGTLVGAFLGVQVGASGKQQTQAAATKAQDLATRALAALPPEKAAEIINK